MEELEHIPFLLEDCYEKVDQRDSTKEEFICLRGLLNCFIVAVLLFLHPIVFCCLAFGIECYFLFRIVYIQLYQKPLYRLLRAVTSVSFVLLNVLFSLFYIQDRTRMFSDSTIWTFGNVGIFLFLGTLTL